MYSKGVFTDGFFFFGMAVTCHVTILWVSNALKVYHPYPSPIKMLETPEALALIGVHKILVKNPALVLQNSAWQEPIIGSCAWVLPYV